jgi:hypothetical protein
MKRLGIAVLVLFPATALADDESPPLSIYGFARLDVLADSSKMSDIERPMFVTPMATRDGELTMTPRLSQVGLGIDRWQVSDHVDGEGKVEIDFGGGNGTNAIRLRHAYGALTYRSRIELLAGQTWDLISPLFPSAQNDTQLLNAGNTGDRRPQLRLSLFPTDKLRIAVAGATSGTIDQQDFDHDGQLDGMASGVPMLQWLVEYRRAVARVGVWGHASRDELADGTKHGSTSVGAHFFAPVSSKLAWFGEGYLGFNAADIGGGIGQGISPMTGHGVHAAGGWIEAAILPTPRHMFSLGGSLDTARPSDLGPGERERNATIYGVMRYKPKQTVQLGIEYLHWETTYKAMTTSDANRVDFHTSVFF